MSDVKELLAERWNKRTHPSVARGLEQARNMQFAENPPDVDGDEKGVG